MGGSKTQRLDARVAAEAKVSRSQAAAMVMAGQIKIDGKPARKPGQSIADDRQIMVTSLPPVSRSAGKLEAALNQWSIPVKGKTALDVGSSTGGFTEILLERGATKVYAVDVGTGQLAWKLRGDRRVISLEQTDIRKVTLPELAELAVIDVSFISLKQVLPAVAKLITPDAPVVALFKPQFEVGKPVADKYRGVIRDEEVIEEALSHFSEWATANQWQLNQRLISPVTGSKGNRERLLNLTRLH